MLNVKHNNKPKPKTQPEELLTCVHIIAYHCHVYTTQHTTVLIIFHLIIRTIIIAETMYTGGQTE